METVEAPFEDFVRAHGPVLHQAAWALTRDVGHAEDLVQAALVSTWGAWSRITGPPLPYARTVLLREFISSRRRRTWGERPHEAGDLATDVPLADSADGSTGEGWGDAIDLHRALLTLPRAQRAVVVCRFLEDMSVQETAAALGISTGTVKSHTSRALAHLRVDPALASEGITR